MKSILVTVIILALFFNAEGHNSIRQKAEKLPAYITLSSGVTISKYRDFATSPLFYKGTVPHYQLSLLKTDEQTENEIGISYTSGIHINSFNNHTAEANVNSASIHYTFLYKASCLSADKLNTKIGGQFNVSGNFRTNERLRNFADSYEIIPTVFFSVKTEWDLSRKIEKEKKLFLGKGQLNSRQQKFSYQLNIGVFNNNARKNLPYYQNSVLSNDDDFFGTLRFKAFSGFRLSSSLNYTTYLQNKNAIQLSYHFSAYKTGNDMNRFEMAQHVLKFALLFNTNNN